MTFHVLPVVAATPDVEHVLAVRGAGGYRRQYWIPALAVLHEGTVLAAYDGTPSLPG